MIRLKNIFLLSTLIYTTFLLSGCSDDDEAPPVDQKPAIAEIHIEPKLSVLSLGTTARFEAFAIDVNGVTTDVSDQVSWSMELSPPILVSKNDPDFPGLSLAVANAAGQDNIVATLGSLSTTAQVSVVQATLASIEVTPVDSTVIVGFSEQFSAAGTYSDGHTQNLTYYVNWVSSNGRLPIDAKGVVTPTDTGPATITADIDGITSAGVQITAELTNKIAAVRLDPQAADLFPGGTVKFNAIAVFEDGRQDVINQYLGSTWDVDNSGWDVATIPVNGPKGLYEAVGVGTTFITFQNIGLKVKESAWFGVSDVEVAEILIFPRDTTMQIGGTMQYKSQATGTDNKTYQITDSSNLTFSVSDPKVAYFTYRPDAKGLLIAVGAGTATVTSTFIYKGATFTANTQVTVTP